MKQPKAHQKPKQPRAPFSIGGAAGGKGAGSHAGGGPPAAKAPPPWRPVSVAHQRQQHRAAVKAAHSKAKNPAPAKKTAAKKQPRKLALGGMVACCAAEALAASLRLTGRPVSDADVLALYRHTAACPDAGATILATLDAAAEHGLAGMRPAGFGPVDLDDPAGVILGLDLPAGPHAVCDDGTCWWSWGQQWSPGDFPGAVTGEAWSVTW